MGKDQGEMKLSIVIICWNDLKVLPDCLKSIYDGTKGTEFEVIVSDNGSTDGSLEWIRANYPAARIVENKANLGYAKGNNAGIAHCTGDYILILNPDTIIHGDGLDHWVEFAERHPEAGAFGCRVLNKDGSYQDPARPFPTNWHYFLVAMRLRQNDYGRFKGEVEREIDWQSGCAVLVRGKLLKELGGFDERFFYHFEEVDLCYRVWRAGWKILHTPEVTITHLGGQSVGRFPTRFELEKYRNRYRYFHKHYGIKGLRRARRVALFHLTLRRFGYGLVGLTRSDEVHKNRMEMLRVVYAWNRDLDPIRFIESGTEPESGFQPLAPAPKVPLATA
jgi:GT2 family glycosyltransferase